MSKWQETVDKIADNLTGPEGTGGKAITAKRGAIVGVKNNAAGVIEAGRGGRGGSGGDAIEVSEGVAIVIENNGTIKGGDAAP